MSVIDPLSDVFIAMHVKTAECVRLEFSAPFGFVFDGYEHAHFGVVTEGSCWLSLDKDPSKTIKLMPGDCWLLPRGSTHILRDQADTEIRSYKEVSSKKAAGVLRHFDGEGPLTTLIIGNFTFDGESAKWLVELLPEFIAFRMDEGGSSAMQTILHVLSSESKNASMGSAIIVSRLADILFVQAVRAHAAQAGERGAGWFRAIGDGQLILALRAMHGAIEQHWTVSSLAAKAGMSRSAFAARFTHTLDESPLEYLTRWRMYKATQLLRETDMKVAKIAGAVGYESDGAFSKSFKKLIGNSPGAYRRSIS